MLVALSACAVPVCAGAKTIPGHYIVVLNGSVKEPGAVAKEHGRKYGVEASNVYGHALKGYAARIPGNRLDALRGDIRVLAVEPDRTFTLAGCPPTSTSQCLPAGLDRIDADLSSTASGDGSGVTNNVNVAVMDTGIDADHPDLNVVGGTNCSVRKNLDPLEDSDGHGTHVAGTIAAKDNEFGVVGVAPGARLWSVRVSAHDPIPTSAIVCGIDFVTGTRTDGDPTNDIDVTNMSLLSVGFPDNAPCTARSTNPLHRSICASVGAGALSGKPTERRLMLVTSMSLVRVTVCARPSSRSSKRSPRSESGHGRRPARTTGGDGGRRPELIVLGRDRQRRRFPWPSLSSRMRPVLSHAQLVPPTNGAGRDDQHRYRCPWPATLTLLVTPDPSPPGRVLRSASMQSRPRRRCEVEVGGQPARVNVRSGSTARTRMWPRNAVKQVTGMRRCVSLRAWP